MNFSLEELILAFCFAGPTETEQERKAKGKTKKTTPDTEMFEPARAHFEDERFDRRRVPDRVSSTNLETIPTRLQTIVNSDATSADLDPRSGERTLFIKQPVFIAYRASDLWVR